MNTVCSALCSEGCPATRYVYASYVRICGNLRLPSALGVLEAVSFWFCCSSFGFCCEPAFLDHSFEVFLDLRGVALVIVHPCSTVAYVHESVLGFHVLTAFVSRMTPLSWGYVLTVLSCSGRCTRSTGHAHRKVTQAHVRCSPRS